MPTAVATTATAATAARHHRRVKIFICCPSFRQCPEPGLTAGCRHAVSLTLLACAAAGVLGRLA
jgi:hypothetical protein